MKQLKNLLFIIALGVLTMSCSTKTETFWVRGVKTQCDMGAGTGMCLNTSTSSSLDQANWKAFYAPIQGFEFKQGVAQKVRVKRRTNKGSAADASKYSYTLDKVVETRNDSSSEIAGQWVVSSINGNAINRMAKLPNLTVNVEDMSISGFNGCNQYSGQINNLTSVYIDLAPIRETKRMCKDMEVPDAFSKALTSIKAYEVSDDQLVFLDDKRMNVLTFMRGKNLNEVSDEINNEWDAVRINGKSFEGTPPHVLISTSKKMFIGNNGCNTFSAYIVAYDASHVKVSNIESDRKLCDDMTTPDAFNQALLKVLTYEVNGDSLILKDANGNEVLAFKVSDKQLSNYNQYKNN